MLLFAQHHSRLATVHSSFVVQSYSEHVGMPCRLHDFFVQPLTWPLWQLH
jgi:hypothetical protein